MVHCRQVGIAKVGDKGRGGGTGGCREAKGTPKGRGLKGAISRLSFEHHRSPRLAKR